MDRYIDKPWRTSGSGTGGPAPGPRPAGMGPVGGRSISLDGGKPASVQCFDCGKGTKTTRPLGTLGLGGRSLFNAARLFPPESRQGKGRNGRTWHLSPLFATRPSRSVKPCRDSNSHSLPLHDDFGEPFWRKDLLSDVLYNAGKERRRAPSTTRSTSLPFWEGFSSSVGGIRNGQSP